MKADLFFKVGIPAAATAVGTAVAAYKRYNGEESGNSPLYKCPTPAAPVQTLHPCPPAQYPTVQYQSDHLHQPQYSPSPHQSFTQHPWSHGNVPLQHAPIHPTSMPPHYSQNISHHLPTAKAAFDCSTCDGPVTVAGCQEQPYKHC